MPELRLHERLQLIGGAEMSWHLRKSWHVRKKRPEIHSNKPTSPTEPKPKPIRLIQPIKPMAPIGFQYYWKDD